MNLESAFAVYAKVKSNPKKNKHTTISNKKVETKQNSVAVKQNGKIKKRKRKGNKKLVGNIDIAANGNKANKKNHSKKIAQNGISSKTSHEIIIDSEDEEPPLLVPYEPPEEIIEATEVHKVNKAKNKKEHKTRDAKDQETFKGSKDTNPTAYGSGVFKWLIYPIKPQDFFENYWEKDVLHIKRGKNKYYEDVLSTTKLDSILRENSLHYTRNVDVVTYENGVKEVHNQDGRAVPCVLWDFYSNGCSIRVLNPQTYDQNVHSIISSLQEYFGTMVGTNVYLTPPGSQGFAPHFDDIEAFIVQLEGKKHWKLYRPKGADVLARDSSHNFNRDDLDEPFMEVCLNAGDLLYFPRGTIHEGRTDEDSHSLHITVSVYQHTAYADLLEHVLPVALKKAANEDVEFRKGLPLNYLKHIGHVNKNGTSSKRTAILRNTKRLLQKLIDHIDVDLAADQLGRKFMYDSMPPLCSVEEAMCSSKYDGDYMKNGKVVNRIEIESETKVRLLRYHCVRLVVEPNASPRLYYCTDNAKFYHGEEEQWLEIDSKMVPGVQMLQNKFPNFVAVEDLPTDSDKLVADLWERGLIVTSEALPDVDSDVDDVDSDDVQLQNGADSDKANGMELVYEETSSGSSESY